MCLGVVPVNKGPEFGLCSRECAIECGVDGVVVNEGLEMGLCSRECAIECSLDVVAVNEEL